MPAARLHTRHCMHNELQPPKGTVLATALVQKVVPHAAHDAIVALQ